MSAGRVTLEASQPHPGGAGLHNCTAPDPSQSVDATILLRRRPASGSEPKIEAILRGEAAPISREDAATYLGADPEDLRKVALFAASCGLTVTESSAAKRSVKVSGTVAQMEAAFGAKLQSCEIGGNAYLYYENALTVPASLDRIIVGVLGLDQRPLARS